MPNYFMKCVSSKVIVLCLLLMVVKSAAPLQNRPEMKKFSVAKRSFLTRERDYLKSKPISEDLRSFIRRFKRRAWEDLIKIKRQDDLKDHMFVVNNGNIEPLENMKDVSVNLPTSNPSGLGNFTVIPLVIPITVKTFTNATMGVNATEYTDEGDDIVPTELARRAEKKTENEIENNGKEEDRQEEQHFDSGGNKDKDKDKYKSKDKEKDKDKEKGKDKDVMSNGNGTTTEIIIENALSTLKPDNMKFLNKVLTDVRDLISYEKEGKPTGTNEGAMCSVLGDWDSNAGGMQLQISGNNETHPHPTIQIVAEEPEADGGFLKIGTWNITAQMPFNHSSFIMMNGVSEKTVASFIGECRICDGAETITGNWLVARRSSNCKDRHETNTFLSDVLRKSNIRKLHKEHLDEMSTRNLVTTTEL